MSTVTHADGEALTAKELSDYQAKREQVKRSLWAQCKRFYGSRGMGQDAIATTLNAALGFPMDGVNGGKLAHAVQGFLQEMEQEGLIRVQVVSRGKSRNGGGDWLTIWAIAPGGDAA